MKLLRYLLSHGILLLLLVALAFAYYYRARLFSADINARIDGVVNKSLAWTEVFADKRSATSPSMEQPQTSSPQASNIESPTAESSMPVPATARQDQDVVVTQDMGQPPSAQANEPAAEQEAIPTPAAEPAAPTAMANTDESSTAQAAAEPENDQAAAANPQLDLLNQARIAFQSGKADESIKLYEELRELNPDDPNVYGELGNVLYAQGKWQQAGEAYYEAASRLLDKGQGGQVQYLYRIIQGLDQESAEKLRSRLGQ
jgi:tetratricopeptide (TPR) repeat protein